MKNSVFIAEANEWPTNIPMVNYKAITWHTSKVLLNYKYFFLETTVNIYKWCSKMCYLVILKADI